MRKWVIGVLFGSFISLLVLMCGVMKNPISAASFSRALKYNTSTPLEWVQPAVPPAIQNPEAGDQVIPARELVSGLFNERNISAVGESPLQTWNLMKQILNYSQGLPKMVEAVREAAVAWDGLLNSIKKKQVGDAEETSSNDRKGKQCPHFVSIMNATESEGNTHRLHIPCGLIQGSFITVIGIPEGLLGNFRIDLMGEFTSGEPDPPIILHYNVRLQGDKLTEGPVIVENTWTAAHDWGDEERCPPMQSENNKKVDELKQCNEKVGRLAAGPSNMSIWSSVSKNVSKTERYFPFKQGYLSVMTLRVGEEGFHTTVDGKHVTSFAYRESLEPWLVNEVKISGDVRVISVLASGLPTSENVGHVDMEALKPVPLPPQKKLDLFVGVFSTANNFKRRMAVRRTWMQYAAVRSGTVAVRFFVGLHKNQIVNEELWNEVQAYGDIQLMPFVDYYSLISWKTVAICIFGTEVVSAKYVMKTDDDSFVRVDEVLASLNRLNKNNGLLYGLINTDSRPHRNTKSKWYISPEGRWMLVEGKEWPEEKYPPWAHGPGYVVSHDIASAMFKLEDVAMGIWIEELKKGGLEVSYMKEDRVFNEGCKDGYVVAHYQSPRDLLCLWQKLQETNEAKCCVDR
ncbi:Galectin, carbohydrate recognition domain [Dillenia turbinata]|uniref:Galectin, carbohydrate recognition domain n=1 Tax=Dillenia turbinata TaxID=194707 RepID=A0AAN8Z6E4_9MAGN